MFRLTRRVLSLVLSRDVAGKNHEVRVYARFREALRDWSPGSRISPIFATSAFEFPTTYSLIFAGPVRPGRVDPACADAAFVTLGLYNLILVVTAPERVQVAINEVRRLGQPCEVWHVNDGHLEAWEVLPARPAQPIPPDILTPLEITEEPLREAAREYSLLIATTASRALAYDEGIVDDIRRFHATFKRVLAGQTGESATVVRQGLLVNANAALSRFSSQTFAGTSPILETECHFWTHSLLGIGTASIALNQLREHVEEIFTFRHRLIDRFVSLADVPEERSLAELPARNEFWSTDHLYERDKVLGDLSPLIRKDSGNEFSPLITFFSGRDGFRSTAVSLSGPLELLSSCNTTPWTMLTLTHEISHALVAGVLAKVFPKPDYVKGWQELSTLIHGKATNLQNQARKYLAYGVLSKADPSLEKEIDPDVLKTALRHNYRELQEVVTHVFDYLYFYNSDAEKYIRCLWVSWGVIPNIESRVEQYVIRSLCALQATSIGQLKRVEDTLSDLRVHLTSARDRFPKTLYVTAALRELDTRREHYVNELKARSRWVRFAMALLHSAKITDDLHDEPGVTGAGHGYTLDYYTLDEKRFTNPLRFLTAVGDDAVTDHAKSVWILQQLAFGRRRDA